MQNFMPISVTVTDKSVPAHKKQKANRDIRQNAYKRLLDKQRNKVIGRESY